MVRFNRQKTEVKSFENDEGHMKDGVLFYKGYTIIPSVIHKYLFRLGLITAEQILTVANKNVSK